jgi:tRNA(Ile)-lysidine synthetase-like protein
MKLAELAREDEAFFEEILGERLTELSQKSGDRTRIGISDLFNPWKEKKLNVEKRGGTEGRRNGKNVEPALALSKRIVRRVVGNLKTRRGELGAEHVEAVLELAQHGQRGKTVQLPGGVEVRRERDELVFLPAESKNKKSDSAPREFAHEIVLSADRTSVNVPELGCVFRFKVIDWPQQRGETIERGTVLDRDRLLSPLVLRSWRPGDTLHPLGRQHAHKLKRLLSEKRVSRWERECWPVLTSNGVLAWARGFPVASEFAANEGTQAGILIAEESL